MQPIVTDRVVWSVGLSPSQPCKSGWSNRDAVCVQDSGWPKETPITYSRPLQGKYCIVLCIILVMWLLSRSK